MVIALANSDGGMNGAHSVAVPRPIRAVSPATDAKEYVVVHREVRGVVAHSWARVLQRALSVR